MDESGVRKQLEALVKKHGTQALAAKSIGTSPQYYGDLLRGRRTPGPKILKALGLTAVTEYK